VRLAGAIRFPRCGINGAHRHDLRWVNNGDRQACDKSE
jgi:hypothetical protein